MYPGAYQIFKLSYDICLFAPSRIDPTLARPCSPQVVSGVQGSPST